MRPSALYIDVEGLTQETGRGCCSRSGPGQSDGISRESECTSLATPFDVLLLSLSSHGLPRSTSLPYSPQNDRASRCKRSKILIGVGPHIPCSLLPGRCRPRPTRHNLPNQYRKILLRHSRSNSMRTLSELSTPTPLPLTSRSPKTASSKCTRRWSQCVAWSSQPMRCTRASSFVVSAISPLARCVLCALLLRVSLTYHIVSYFLPFRKPSQSVLSRL